MVGAASGYEIGDFQNNHCNAAGACGQLLTSAWSHASPCVFPRQVEKAIPQYTSCIRASQRRTGTADAAINSMTRLATRPARSLQPPTLPSTALAANFFRNGRTPSISGAIKTANALAEL